ncbi:TraB/GumN family protein [Pseudoduganella sp. DS3]|uniref:TraB/GumN family protein n=1 Tax=Pseudoduganella guangdongensis TaxID=2692179 RepID=A0A6N9HBN0_9BURK|nr:TraB/GumN family protein [Pseudoduganella guangdongensis]MYN00627.1 TraB/GumN family protein [Pseudoduganella guangdongensis]
MMKKLIPFAVAAMLAGAACAQEELAAPEGEQVVITGQRPGPGLWKVSKGEHVLYVFGDYAPLPTKMDWRSHEVEAILSKSQEYLPKPDFGISVGLWGGLKMLPFAIGFKDNPDGAKLVDVLPAETYDRWQVLKARYIGNDSGIERERPMFAATTLYKNGLEKNGLTMRTGVSEKIHKIAQQYKVKTTSSSVHMALDDPAQALKAFKKSPGADTSCFIKTVDNLESDLEAMRVRANAWAIGDMSKITSLNFAERDEACKDAVMKNDAFRSNEKLVQAEKTIAGKWLANAERALEANNTTFAVLSLARILDPKGPLAELKARGYKVEAPE